MLQGFFNAFWTKAWPLICDNCFLSENYLTIFWPPPCFMFAGKTRMWEVPTYRSWWKMQMDLGKFFSMWRGSNSIDIHLHLYHSYKCTKLPGSIFNLWTMCLCTGLWLQVWWCHQHDGSGSKGHCCDPYHMDYNGFLQ